MKYLILLLAFTLTRCSQNSQIADPPSATILSATKTCINSNCSIKITYHLSNTSGVSRTLIANQNYGFSGAQNAEIPTVDGDGIVYDYGNSNYQANYYFIFTLSNGSQITTPIMTFYF